MERLTKKELEDMQALIGGLLVTIKLVSIKTGIPLEDLFSETFAYTADNPVPFGPEVVRAYRKAEKEFFGEGR